VSGTLSLELGHLSFGDPCPFGSEAEPCPMRVGVIAWSDQGERLPMCELHLLGAEWSVQDADGARHPYEPRVQRPGDTSSGPVTTDPALPAGVRAGLGSEDLLNPRRGTA
jgi:hypothetical protein